MGVIDGNEASHICSRCTVKVSMYQQVIFDLGVLTRKDLSRSVYRRR